METPSPVKRKATIDLTRSDSDDEAPKRQRRVIEIGSDDDDDEAPRPTTTMPWETPEWRAHCEKHPSRRLAGVLTSLLGTNQEQSDEELWREINDPVGAKRMELTRMLAGEKFARLRSTDYIEREVAEFARKLDGPCECLRDTTSASAGAPRSIFASAGNSAVSTSTVARRTSTSARAASSATTNATSAGPSSTSEGRARATRNFNSSPNFLE